MTVRGALGAALRDLYDNGWRLIALNSALSAVTIAVLAAATWAQPALLLLVALGPLVAALMHCAVTVQQTDELRLGEVVVGLRRHWRRGLALGVVIAAAGFLAGVSVPFWGRAGVVAWPLAVAALYVALLFALWQIHVWPLAVSRRDGLGDVFRAAAAALVRRPRATVAFAFALLVLNLVAAVGILPVLTLTIAYSALATAHFVLPPPPEEAAS